MDRSEALFFVLAPEDKLISVDEAIDMLKTTSFTKSDWSTQDPPSIELYPSHMVLFVEHMINRETLNNEIHILKKIIYRNRNQQRRSVHYRKLDLVQRHLSRLETLKTRLKLEIETKIVLEGMYGKKEVSQNPVMHEQYIKTLQTANYKKLIKMKWTRIVEYHQWVSLLKLLDDYKLLLQSTISVIQEAYQAYRYQISQKLFMTVALTTVAILSRLQTTLQFHIENDLIPICKSIHKIVNILTLNMCLQKNPDLACNVLETPISKSKDFTTNQMQTEESKQTLGDSLINDFWRQGTAQSLDGPSTSVEKDNIITNSKKRPLTVGNEESDHVSSTQEHLTPKFISNSTQSAAKATKSIPGKKKSSSRQSITTPKKAKLSGKSASDEIDDIFGSFG